MVHSSEKKMTSFSFALFLRKSQEMIRAISHLDQIVNKYRALYQ